MIRILFGERLEICFRRVLIGVFVFVFGEMLMLCSVDRVWLRYCKGEKLFDGVGGVFVVFGVVVLVIFCFFLKFVVDGMVEIVVGLYL